MERGRSEVVHIWVQLLVAKPPITRCVFLDTEIRIDCIPKRSSGEQGRLCGELWFGTDIYRRGTNVDTCRVGEYCTPCGGARIDHGFLRCDMGVHQRGSPFCDVGAN